VRAVKTRKAAEVLPFLPAAVRNRLEELAATLQKTLGDKLHALVLHGSAVRGGYVAGTSGVDVVVVLTDDAPALLESVGPALRLAHAAARIECTLLRLDEIQRSADVFPLLYADIKDAHAMMHGADPFAALEIKSEHRRLRIEQELREASLSLRRLVAYDDLAGPALGAPLAHLVKRLRSPLRALLALLGDDVKDDHERVLAAAGKRFDVDTTSLSSPAKKPHDALIALKRLLDAATRAADALVVPA
jgi:hypothetical protein